MSGDDELMDKARRLLDEARDAKLQLTEEARALGIDLTAPPPERTSPDEIKAGDRVAATARWGVYVQRSDRGTVVTNRHSGEPNILWDRTKIIDYDLQTGTGGPFRIISAVEQLGEVVS